MEIVAGTHHRSPGGVGFFDQRGKLCACGEKFNVDQIGAVGGKNGADKMKILFVGQSDFTAFGFCAEGEKNICCVSPRCEKCVISEYCNYKGKSEK